MAVTFFGETVGPKYLLHLWTQMHWRNLQIIVSPRGFFHGHPPFRMPVKKETYKYLGLLESDTIKQVEIKEKLKKNRRGKNFN